MLSDDKIRYYVTNGERSYPWNESKRKDNVMVSTLVDKKKLEEAGYLILQAVNAKLSTEESKRTAQRFAAMIAEQCAFMAIDNSDIAKEFNKTFECRNNDIVIVKNIPCFSICEHHLALMYNMKISVGYIPNGRVIGLSKIARIADAASKRLQLQERIGEDIIDVLEQILNIKDVIVHIQAEHACVTARGIAKPGTVTETVACDGTFCESARKMEFLQAIRL